MQLYEKIMQGKRTTYREYKPEAGVLPDMVIESEEVITILTTLVISMLMAIENQLAPHMKLSRETKLLEQAVLRYATLNRAKLEPALIDVGVDAWNAAIKAVQQGLIRVRP